MLLLEQNTIKKGQVDNKVKLEKDNSKEYKFEAIHDNKVNTKESNSEYLLSFYYLVS